MIHQHSPHLISRDTVSLEVHEHVEEDDDDHVQDGSKELGLDHSKGDRRGTFFIELPLDSKNK